MVFGAFPMPFMVKKHGDLHAIIGFRSHLAQKDFMMEQFTIFSFFNVIPAKYVKLAIF